MELREFKLERYLAQYEFTAPYLLCTSDCETLSVSELLNLDNGSSEGLKDLKLGYTESSGSPVLKTEIAKWYDSINPSEIIVTSGAEETIFLTMHALLKPGDHVIVQTPAYQSLTEIPLSIGCQVSAWEMVERNGAWETDLDALAALITSCTRVLIINSPHNPTGYQFSSGQWHAIQEICQDHSVRIISDEVYRGIEHNPRDRRRAMADCMQSGVSIGVMSKSLGLAGLRIGWVASKDTKFLKKFQALKDYTTICNSAPSEYLSTVALKQKETIISRNLKIIDTNLQILHQFFVHHTDQVTWSPPVAGSTAFPRLASKSSVETFCDELRKEQGVLLLPGTVFQVGTPHFRIGYGRRDMPGIFGSV